MRRLGVAAPSWDGATPTRAPPATSGGWPKTGLPVDAYYTTEVTAHGYRISVKDRTTDDDGHSEATITIEPV